MSKKRKSPKEYHYEPPIEQEQEPRSEPKFRLKMVYLLDQDEINSLIEASHAPYVEPPREFEQVEYSSYDEDEVLSLMDGRPYRRKRKKKSVSETT